MSHLPPELDGFAALLDAQPTPVREIFQYSLCLMMVEAGKMRLVDTISGDASPISVYKTTVGVTFSVARPPMSQIVRASFSDHVDLGFLLWNFTVLVTFSILIFGLIIFRVRRLNR